MADEPLDPPPEESEEWFSDFDPGYNLLNRSFARTYIGKVRLRQRDYHARVPGPPVLRFDEQSSTQYQAQVVKTDSRPGRAHLHMRDWNTGALMARFRIENGGFYNAIVFAGELVSFTWYADEFMPRIEGPYSGDSPQ